MSKFKVGDIVKWKHCAINSISSRYAGYYIVVDKPWGNIGSGFMLPLIKLSTMQFSHMSEHGFEK